MIMKYPKEYLDEIKLRLKVSSVVGKYIQLKKRGKEFIGLSPFKNEKTPSFTVSDEKGFYHCFSSGEHGNIFDFLMKTKSLSFGEAVKSLAAEAGMQPFRFTNFDKEKEKRYSIYKKIYSDYLNFFHKKLFEKENIEVLNYLKTRGIDEKAIKNFNLGFVTWKNDFHEHLTKKYSEEDIKNTELYFKSERTGKFVDRFNSRIIFPINNLSGETIAFGGRVVKDGKFAKYINSPETEFYKKGKVVFNLDKAKNLRTETNNVIIVEGYMDVISLFNSGVKNVVSNSGIAITEMQIELIWKFFSSPIICLDGDKSGQNASLRIAERLISLINENNIINFVILPKGEDPDDFVKKNGKDKFLDLLKSKKVIQSFIWETYSKEINKKDPFAISKFEKKIKQLSYTIKDETLRKHILESFLEKMSNFTPIQSTRKNFKNFKVKDFKILNETKKLHSQKNHLTEEQLKEYSILYLLLNNSDIVTSKIEEISQIHFKTEICESLKKDLLNFVIEKKDFNKSILIIKEKYGNFIEEIERNSGIKSIVFKKTKNEKEELLDELLEEIKKMNQLRKLEDLENKFAKNMDENSYAELVQLKSQLNRE